MWGLTHAGQQMSGSLRLGQLISMTNSAPQPPPNIPTLQEALLLSSQVEAMGHRWCWFLWRATVDDCQNALGLVEREGCRLVQPFSSWTHTLTCLTQVGREDICEYPLFLQKACLSIHCHYADIKSLAHWYQQWVVGLIFLVRFKPLSHCRRIGHKKMT